MRQYFLSWTNRKLFCRYGRLTGILKRRAFFIFRNFLLTEGCPICIIVLETQYNNTSSTDCVSGRRKTERSVFTEKEQGVKWSGDLTIRSPFTQIVDVIRLRIITGRYRAGSRLPSVRELAGEASVNPNTMQKALTELEDQD